MNWSTLRAFASQCERLDITPPAGILRGLELIAVAEQYQASPSGGLLSLSDDEMRERVVALSIREHDRDGRASARGLTPGLHAVSRELALEIKAAILPDLNAIVADLQPQFDALAAPLVTAAQEYGFTIQTSSDQVIDLADEGASAAWRAARTAWHAIAPIVALRISISSTFDVSPTQGEARAAAFPRIPRDATVNYSVCFAAADNWSLTRGYYVEGKTVGHLDWFALAAGGLRLNTPEDVRAKLDERGINSLPVPGHPQVEGMPTDPMAYTYPTGS